MTHSESTGPQQGDAQEPAEPTVIRDRRRIDPETGQLREQGTAGGASSEPADQAAASSDKQPGDEHAGADQLGGAAADLAAERLADLQRLQAEYVNYRKRVERDRDVAKDKAVASVMEALLPVMDDIAAARQHDELTGPFAAIAEKLDGVLRRFGMESYGEEGAPFDPAVHEALMQNESDEVTEPVVAQVLQLGYMHQGRILRAARVAVSAPAD
ncbi:MAG: nucleotide exchange factor GrpE [Micrococcales bacterium]|nr:MAG: nucleotide exchange factor GrpE [Micrococcales bacterium]